MVFTTTYGMTLESVEKLNALAEIQKKSKSQIVRDGIDELYKKYVEKQNPA
jgi:predicted DNA-binding protein